MNKEIEYIQNMIIQGNDKFVPKKIPFLSLESKLYFVKNGNFIDILENDSSLEVKLALINQGHNLYHFCDDKDWRVRLEVLKVHGRKYNDHFYFEDEHPEVQKQFLENGVDINDYLDPENETIVQYAIEKYGHDWAYENDLLNNIENFSVNMQKILFDMGEIKKVSEILNNKELTLYAIPHITKGKIEKIFEETNDPDIIKSCIENSLVIQNFSHHDKISIFLTSLKNRLWAIEKNLFLEVMLKKENYDTCKETFKCLIRNNYLNYEYDLEKNKKVSDLIPKFFNSDIAIMIAERNQEYLMENKIFYNDRIISAIINNVTCLELVAFLMKKTRDVNIISTLNQRKKKLLDIDNQNGIISIHNNSQKNELIKQL